MLLTMEALKSLARVLDMADGEPASKLKRFSACPFRAITSL